MYIVYFKKYIIHKYIHLKFYCYRWAECLGLNDNDPLNKS